jgi:hypothetical protein
MIYIYPAIAALLIGLLVYRFVRLSRAVAETRAPLTLLDGGLAPSSHMVFAGPIEHNEHGFITTPRTACVDPNCMCRKGLGGPRP